MLSAFVDCVVVLQDPYVVNALSKFSEPETLFKHKCNSQPSHNSLSIFVERMYSMAECGILSDTHWYGTVKRLKRLVHGSWMRTRGSSGRVVMSQRAIAIGFICDIVDRA